MADDAVHKNLLVVSTEYYSFVKDQVETVAKFLPKITVLVRHNPIAEISSLIPISSLVNCRKSYLIRDTDTPSNVTVVPTPVVYLPLDSQYRRLGDLHYRAVRDSIRLNGLEFDLIHAHATWSAGYAGAKLKEEYGVPLVVTAHGYDIYSLPFKDAGWRERIEYVLNSSDAIITVSRRNLECIRRLDVDTPVHVIPNGFRSDLFYPRDRSECREQLGLSQDRRILLTVGNLESVKGQKHLVEAVGRIVETEKDLLCLIVGMGGERRALGRQIRALGLDDNVRLVGAKPHEEIPMWINACDLFVLPSLDEGNPTVMFEALACGKPFIGTRVGGVPDVIVADRYGLLAEPGNSSDLEENIQLSLDREWDPESIREYANQFTWESISMEIQTVYNEVLGEVA